MAHPHSEEVYSVTQLHPAHLIPTDPLPAAGLVLPSGLTIASTTFPARHWAVHAPAYAEQHLVIPLDRAMDLTCTLERRYHVCATPGDIMIAPRGVPTTWQHQGGVHLLLVFLAPALLAQVALEAFDTDPAQTYLVEQAATPDPLSYALTRALLGAVQSGDGAHRLYGESLAHTLVVHLLHTYAPPCQHLGGARGRFGFPQLQVVRDYIMAHLAHPLSLAELAALVNLSPYHFARVFKRTTGFTVHQYVLQQRIQTGKRLLETSDLPIATVAMQVGFADHSHFWRHFKRIVGVAPGSVQRPRTIVHRVRTNIQDRDEPARYTR